MKNIFLVALLLIALPTHAIEDFDTDFTKPPKLTSQEQTDYLLRIFERYRMTNISNTLEISSRDVVSKKISLCFYTRTLRDEIALIENNKEFYANENVADAYITVLEHQLNKTKEEIGMSYNKVFKDFKE